MNDKCEICGCTAGLVEVYFCACDEESPYATLCEKCKKKYFDYMLPGPGGLPIHPPVPAVTYIPWLDYASNLVYAYNVRYGNSDKTTKKENTTMQVTYKGFTGEMVKLEKKETGAYKITPYDMHKHPVYVYDISLYDREKQVTHSFNDVMLEDVKFSGGAVSFGG